MLKKLAITALALSVATTSVQAEQRRAGPNESGNALIGMLIGGAIGNKIAKKKNQKAIGTIVGALVGGSIGAAKGRQKDEYEQYYIERKYEQDSALQDRAGVAALVTGHNQTWANPSTGSYGEIRVSSLNYQYGQYCRFLEAHSVKNGEKFYRGDYACSPEGRNNWQLNNN